MAEKINTITVVDEATHKTEPIISVVVVNPGQAFLEGTFYYYNGWLRLYGYKCDINSDGSEKPGTRGNGQYGVVYGVKSDNVVIDSYWSCASNMYGERVLRNQSTVEGVSQFGNMRPRYWGSYNYAIYRITYHIICKLSETSDVGVITSSFDTGQGSYNQHTREGLWFPIWNGSSTEPFPSITHGQNLRNLYI